MSDPRDRHFDLINNLLEMVRQESYRAIEAEQIDYESKSALHLSSKVLITQLAFESMAGLYGEVIRETTQSGLGREVTFDSLRYLTRQFNNVLQEQNIDFAFTVFSTRKSDAN